MVNQSASGNRCYRYAIKLPLTHERPQKIGKKKGNLKIVAVSSKYLLVSDNHSMWCFNSISRDLIWEKGVTTENGVFAINDENVCFLTERESGISAVDLSSGEYLWHRENLYPYLQTDSNFYAKITNSDKEIIVCVDKVDGSEIWKYCPNGPEKAGVYPTVSSNNIVVCSSKDGFITLSESSGELIWELRTTEFMEQHFPNKLAKWKKRPGGGGALAPKVPNKYLGCVDQNKVFVSWDVGTVVALDLQTADVLWHWNFPDTLRFPIAKTIICKNDELYLHNNQGRGSVSNLYCLDAVTGELKFNSKDTVTPDGCSYAVIINDYFVGGSGHYLGVWDLASRECVWLYNYKKTDLFSMYPTVVPNGLVFANPDDNCLHWLTST